VTKPLRAWQKEAIDFFEVEATHSRRVFTREQIGQILNEHQADFKAPRTLTLSRLIDFLTTQGELRREEIRSEYTSRILSGNPVEGDLPGYKPFTRYIWGSATAYEVALSLRGGSYLSHASAVFLHGLTQQIIRAVYANKEQSPKPAPRGALTQNGIDSAFSRPPRLSQYVYMFEGTRIVLLSGKHTANLEVSELPGPAGIPVLATKLERTLVDITVRPTYAGGVFEVLEAYRGALGRASIATLLATLKRLEYVYPYHQAIGFYMERAGYPSAQLEKVRARGLQYDFYLANQMPGAKYDPTWRVYYPEGL
jgi:hypothetical protein